jgi:hypothetical protein
MALLDAQLTFSNLYSGDSPTLIQDSPSTNYIDQMPANLNYAAPGGGSYVGMWAGVRIATAFTSSGSATIIAVVQDAPDPSTTMVPSGPTTWTDRTIGPTFTVGGTVAPTINQYLLLTRINASLARYIRVVYRIAVAAMTAGTVQSILLPDTDVIDIAMRETAAYLNVTGQIQQAVSQGILAQ